MMSAFRTPTKQQEEETNPPSTPPKIVKKLTRRSLEKWEGAPIELTSTDSTSTGVQGALTISKPKTTTPKQVDISKDGREVLVHSPPKSTDRTRVQRATALFTKAKLAMGSSRNLKTEIKESILESLAGLRKLVAESEADLKAERARKEGEGAVKVVPATTDTDTTFTVPPDSGLSAKLDEHSRLLLESNERMKALQEQLLNCSRAAEEQQRSYANVAAVRPHQPLRPAALHSVVITSKDEGETGEEVLGKVRRTMDAKEGWIKVDRVRKAKDRKVIMGFGTAEERTKAKERLGKEGSGLVVEDVKNRDPLLVLRGVQLRVRVQ